MRALEQLLAAATAGRQLLPAAVAAGLLPRPGAGLRLWQCAHMLADSLVYGFGAAIARLLPRQIYTCASRLKRPRPHHGD